MVWTFLLALQGAELPRTLGAPAWDEEKVVDPHSDEDDSGTNPTNLQRAAKVFNRYLAFDAGGRDAHLNELSVRYLEPFADGAMALGLTVPLASAELGGRSESGLGDVSLSYNWVAHDGALDGVIVGLEAVFDTASDELIGRGKTLLAPSALFEAYLYPWFIVTVAYRHGLSVGGDDERPDIREGRLAFSAIYTSPGKTRWVILSPTAVFDYENEVEFAVIEVEGGLLLAPVGEGALGVYLRPGVGVGEDRAFDWSVEAGVQVVGF